MSEYRIKRPNYARKHISVFFLALALMGWAMPAAADTPPGLTDMLNTVAAKDDKPTFDTMVAVALETWPESRTDILKAASDIRADWLTADSKQELADAEQAAIDAEKKSRARGIIWYLDPSLWNVSAQFGGSTSTGDTNVQSANFGLALNRDFGKKWSHAFNFDFDFSRNSGAVNYRRVQARYVTMYKAWDTVFVGNYIEYDSNRFSGFEHRIIEGLGLGTHLFKTARHSLQYEGGLGFRFNKFEITGDTSIEFLGRVAGTYELKLTDNIKFKDQASAIFGTSSFTFDNRASLDAQINTRLTARVSLQLQYESNLPAFAAPWDTITRATLVYKF